jgi:hypothetical protein
MPPLDRLLVRRGRQAGLLVAAGLIIRLIIQTTRQLLLDPVGCQKSVGCHAARSYSG